MFDNVYVLVLVVGMFFGIVGASVFTWFQVVLQNLFLREFKEEMSLVMWEKKKKEERKKERKKKGRKKKSSDAGEEEDDDDDDY